jgi:hypothetical protein
MADKKISELPLLNSVSGSSMIIPVVHDGTTVKVNLSQIGHYASQWSAKTGSANTFAGTQTFSGNVNINGRLTVHEIYANYETSSILYTSGSSQFGDQTSDVHTFVGTILLNGSALGDSGINSFTASQLAVNLGISSVTGSINTTTSSFDSVFQRISSTTGSINTTTSSFDLVFRGISSVTGAINTTTSSFDTVFERISSTTGSINTTTSSFDSVFVRISSTTGSINTTTSSFDLVFRGISSVTGAMNTQSSSQDLVNRQVSLVTGSIHFVTGAFNAFTGSVVGQTNTIATFTSSVNFATQSLNTQTGSQDSVNFRIASTTGSINTTTSSFDLVFRGISSVTGAMNTQSSSQDLVNRGISSVTGSINTTTSSFDLVFRGISSVTGAINLTTSSLIGITNGLMAFTAALDNTYATDAQLYQLYQATASIHSTTASLNTQTGSQDLVNRGISSVTGSINTTTSSFNNVFLGISSVTGAINTQSSSQDLVNLGISSVTGSLIGITNGLMAFTAALDNTYATDAQLYQLYQATASVHFATQSLNTQTGSQDLVNLGISTFTGSLRSEVNLIEAYTASLKAAGIVSSSQQITNYYKFAETASANTFYGNQTFASSGGSGLRVYGGSGTHQWDIYLNGQNVRLSDNTVGDGAVIIDQRLNVGGHVTASGNLYIGGALQVQSDSAAITLKQTGTTAGTGIYLERSGEQKGYYMYLGGAVDSLNFQRNNAGTKADVLSLSRDGDVTVSTGNLIIGTSGKGIDFSATSNGSGTMSSELLNDYEEGTWSPVITDLTNDATMDGTFTVGTYTKIGRQVTVRGYVLTTSLGSVSGNVKIKGLPFANGGGYGSLGGGSVGTTDGLNITAGHSVTVSTPLGQSYLGLNVFDSATGTTEMTSAEWSADGQIQFSATYFV